MCSNPKPNHLIIVSDSNSPEVLAVTCADKLDNLWSIREDYAKLGDKVWERFNASAEKEKWYYLTLADVFLKRAEGSKYSGLFNQYAREAREFFQGR